MRHYNTTNKMLGKIRLAQSILEELMSEHFQPDLDEEAYLRAAINSIKGYREHLIQSPYRASREQSSEKEDV